jgi:hypothetical protein
MIIQFPRPAAAHPLAEIGASLLVLADALPDQHLIQLVDGLIGKLDARQGDVDAEPDADTEPDPDDEFSPPADR